MTPAPARTVHRGFDGATIAGEGTELGSMLFVHANGFCKELWRPVVTRSVAAQRSGWLSIDQRGHGDSAEGEAPYLWDDVASDVVEIVGAMPGPVVGVGHSSGGAAIARAAILAPGLFSHLVLIEPIVLPPPYERRDIPLAGVAERRSASFESRDAARARFAGGAFSSWSDEALDLYVDYGFSGTEEGWTLKCNRKVEADYFREGTNVDTWDRLHEIVEPVSLIAGGNSDSLREPDLSDLVNRFTSIESTVVGDAGHLLPMEMPDVVASLIDEAAGSLAPSGTQVPSR